MRGEVFGAFPQLARVFAPLVDQGELGVELFFILSGFVLALNYRARLGQRFSWKASGRFYWARVARLWPAFMTMLLVGMAFRAFFQATGRTDPTPAYQFDAMSLLRQTLLIGMWGTDGAAQGLAWNGPSWSISAEALAYTIFPLLALLILRLEHLSPIRTRVLLTALTMAPYALFVLANHGVGGPYSWIYRILCCFLAGMLLCSITESVDHSSRKVQVIASITSLISLIFFILGSYWMNAHGHADDAPVLSMLFVPLLGGLALARGPVARLLGSRLLVWGGKISYCVYLVHIFVIVCLWQLKDHYHWQSESVELRFSVVLVIPLSLLLGHLLWRYVETPGHVLLIRMRVTPFTSKQ